MERHHQPGPQGWYSQCFLDVGGVHLNGRRAPNEIQGKDNSTDFLLADKNSFHALKRPAQDPDTGPYAQVRMWLDVQSAKNAFLQSNNLTVWKGARFPTEANEVNNTGSLQNMPSVAQIAAHENVARKKRQFQTYAAIFPPARGTAQRKKMVDATGLKLGGDALLMMCRGI